MSRSGTISNLVMFGGRWAVTHKNQKHDALRFTAHFAAVLVFVSVTVFIASGWFP
jgi:hypothetical protein